jgi:hypothetical protein
MSDDAAQLQESLARLKREARTLKRIFLMLLLSDLALLGVWAIRAYWGRFFGHG